jgi:hypothetical protein
MSKRPSEPMLHDYSPLDAEVSMAIYVELKKHPPLSTTTCLWNVGGKPCGRPRHHIHKGQAYCVLHDPCNPVDEDVE